MTRQYEEGLRGSFCARGPVNVGRGPTLYGWARPSPNPVSRIADFVLVALLLVPAPASAGTQGNPEVTDPSGDVAISYGLVPSPRDNRDAIDILAGWVSENVTRVSFQIRVVDLTRWNSQTVPGEIYFWQFSFGINRSSIVYSAAASYQGTQWHYTLGFYDEADKYRGFVIDGSANFSSSVVSLRLPKALLNLSAGMTLTNLFVQTNDQLPEQTVYYNDYAYSRGPTDVFYRLGGQPDDSQNGQNPSPGTDGDGSKSDHALPATSAGFAAILLLACLWVVRKRRGT